MNLRSELNPEEQTDLVDGPTEYPRGPNQFELDCGVCGEPYFVDEVIYGQAVKAMELGDDNPFNCENCLMEVEELSH